MFSAIWLSKYPLNYILEKIKENFKDFKEHSQGDTKIERGNPAQRAHEVGVLEKTGSVTALGNKRQRTHNIMFFFNFY